MNAPAKVVSVGLFAVMAMVLSSAPMPAQASRAQGQVVSENPFDATPHVVLGTNGETVFDFAQIGTAMFVGGKFNAVQDPKRTKVYPRQNFFVFQTKTGVVSTLTLSFDNLVTTLVPAADGKALFIGGYFKHVNGIARPAIIKYDLVNRRVDPTFNASTGGGAVEDAQLVRGRLVVGGSLPGSLVALSPTTGAKSNYITAAIAGVMNNGDVTKVLRFAVDPQQTRLVAVGNFATVDGHVRRWAFELSLGSTSAPLNAWHPARLDKPCSSSTPLNIAQGVDFSPDGTYFVIVTTGNVNVSGVDGLCDGAARYMKANVSGIAKESWVNFTGGDSLYAVAVTDKAVYVGGHARWLNNPEGHDSKGPGAVDRDGIGALNPSTGKANSWNPTKTRNHGVQTFLATSAGLWVGSDGQEFHGEYHAGIAFCPLPK